MSLLRYGPFGDRALITFAASVAVVALLAYMVGEGAPLPGSEGSVELLARLHAGPIDDLMRFVTDLGSGAVVGSILLVVCAALAFQRRWHELAVGLTGGALIALGVPELKDAIGRDRPDGGLVATSSFAFPSGHAAQATVYLYLAALWGRVGPPGRNARAAMIGALALAALIGLSRIYLGVHHLDDVIAGWAYGLAAFTLWPVAGMARDRFRHNLRSTAR